MEPGPQFEGFHQPSSRYANGRPASDANIAHRFKPTPEQQYLLDESNARQTINKGLTGAPGGFGSLIPRQRPPE